MSSLVRETFLEWHCSFVDKKPEGGLKGYTAMCSSVIMDEGKL